MNNKSMKSLREAMKIKSKSTLSLYSPTRCPICLASYDTGEEIAWSKNEECHHAFHLECIMGWLMDHDSCPMCRLNYLDVKGVEDVEVDESENV